MRITYINESVFKNIKDLKSDESSLDYSENAKMLYIKQNRNVIIEAVYKFINNQATLCGGRVKCCEDMYFNDNNQLEIILKMRRYPSTADIYYLNIQYLKSLQDLIGSWKYFCDSYIYEFGGLKKSVYSLTFKFDMSDIFKHTDFLFEADKTYHMSLLAKPDKFDELQQLFNKYVLHNRPAVKIVLTHSYFDSFLELKNLRYMFNIKKLAIAMKYTSSYAAREKLHYPNFEGIENILRPGAELIFVNDYISNFGKDCEEELTSKYKVVNI